MPAPSPVPSITTAPHRAELERDARTRRYLMTMAVRTACFVLAYFTEGWLRWTCVVLATVLPYIAVVLANAVRPRGVDAAMTPAGRPRHHLGR